MTLTHTSDLFEIVLHSRTLREFDLDDDQRTIVETLNFDFDSVGSHTLNSFPHNQQ
jgi:hypothetical protein